MRTHRIDDLRSERTDGDLLRGALERLRPELNLEGKSADYMRGALQQTLLSKSDAKLPLGAIATTEWARESGEGVPQPDYDRDHPDMLDALEERNQASKRKSKDAWKTPAKGAMTRDSLRKSR
jgi:hypothetical protein